VSIGLEKMKKEILFWPGFGDNMRMLKWIVERVNGEVSSIESPIGWMPKYQDIDWGEMKFSPEEYDAVMEVDREAWKNEILAHRRIILTNV